MNTTSFDGLAPAFFAINEDQSESNFSAFAFNNVDGFESGTSGGDDIIDNDDRIGSLEVAFDLAAVTVAFGFLAYGKDLQCFRRMKTGGGHANGEGNRIRPEGHTANGMNCEVRRMDLGADGMPAKVTDKIGTEGIECGDPAIDVKIALFARGEGEISGTDGFFEKQGFQGGGGLVHARGWKIYWDGASTIGLGVV